MARCLVSEIDIEFSPELPLPWLITQVTTNPADIFNILQRANSMWADCRSINVKGRHDVDIRWTLHGTGARDTRQHATVEQSARAESMSFAKLLAPEKLDIYLRNSYRVG